jgi:hypothetical protein
MGPRVSTRAFAVAVAIARAWTRLYTLRLAAEIAEMRRAEIECDIWEMQQDPEADLGWPGALTVLARLFDGAVDDLAWRVEQAPAEEQLFLRRAAAVMAAAVLIVGVWTVPALFAGGMRNVTACAGEAPTPEAAPDLRFELVRCAGAFFLARD